MNFNCITPDLVFVQSKIVELQIKNKIDAIDDSMAKSLGMDIVPTEISSDADYHYGRLLLKIVVNISDHNEDFSSIELLLEGVFASPIAVDEETFRNLVLVNGATALYAVARGKLESITASVFSEGKILIPFVNILEYYKEKKE